MSGTRIRYAANRFPLGTLMTVPSPGHAIKHHFPLSVINEGAHMTRRPLSGYDCLSHMRQQQKDKKDQLIGLSTLCKAETTRAF